MAIQSSGVINLQDIEDEFGGSAPTSLTEYYRNGSYVTANNTSVPNSGQPISLTNFYGAVKQFSFNITSSAQNANIRTLAVAAGWDGSVPLVANVNSGIYLWSDDITLGGVIISGSFPSGITLVNSGYIIGKGGSGGNTNQAGGAGGPALYVSSTGVSVTNNSGAYIAGGGGGGQGGQGAGGGGAGGGTGGSGGGETINGAGGAGGAIGVAGSKGGDASSAGGGYGGGSGGAGGGADQDDRCCHDSGAAGGGGGGRILPGVGGLANGSYDGTAGAGGDSNNVGGTRTGAAGWGGGGWGASGGGSTGGSGGAAISLASGVSITSTNNGTIWGTA